MRLLCQDTNDNVYEVVSLFDAEGKSTRDRNKAVTGTAKAGDGFINFEVIYPSFIHPVH